MPITYDIDETLGVVRTLVTGRLTDEQLIAHKHRLLADPRFTPGMKELSDVRGVEAMEVTPRGIAAAVSFDSSHSSKLDGHRLALLVPTDLVFGMARMYEMSTEGNTGGVQVFRSEDEALGWLEAE